MGNEVTYLFDSYALIALYEKDPAYEPFATVNAATTYLHVLETYYALSREGYSTSEIEEFFQVLTSLCINLDFNWIPLAVAFKKKHHKKKLSYADCIGYVVAQQQSMLFLTGDKEFEHIQGVKFVTAQN